MPSDVLVAGGCRLRPVIAEVGCAVRYVGAGVDRHAVPRGLACSGGSGVKHDLDERARLAVGEHQADHSEAALGVGVYEVQLGSERLAVDRMLGRRVYVHRLKS